MWRSVHFPFPHRLPLNTLLSLPIPSTPITALKNPLHYPVEKLRKIHICPPPPAHPALRLMEATLPNLLVRGDPADSPFSPGSASRGGDHSHDHDPFGISIRAKPLAVGGGGSGGGSPLCVSPPALRLGVKDRKDVSPRSVVTTFKVKGDPTEDNGKAAAGGSRGEDMLEQTRLLSLGIWENWVGVEDLAAAAGDQGFPEKEGSAGLAAPGVA